MIKVSYITKGELELYLPGHPTGKYAFVELYDVIALFKEKAK